MLILRGGAKQGKVIFLQFRLRDMRSAVGQGNTLRMGAGHKRVSKEAIQAG